MLFFCTVFTGQRNHTSPALRHSSCEKCYLLFCIFTLLFFFHLSFSFSFTLVLPRIPHFSRTIRTAKKENVFEHGNDVCCLTPLFAFLSARFLSVLLRLFFLVCWWLLFLLFCVRAQEKNENRSSGVTVTPAGTDFLLLERAP